MAIGTARLHRVLQMAVANGDIRLRHPECSSSPCFRVPKTMKNRMSLVCLLAASVIAQAAEPGLTVEEASAFFERAQALADAFDPAFADLYDDAARIKADRRYPGGFNRDIEVAGAQWKEVIRIAMPLAKARDDRSEFTNVRFDDRGNAVRITAERYSTLKCYTDKNWYTILEKQSDGKIRIVEEYAATQAFSSCGQDREKGDR